MSDPSKMSVEELVGVAVRSAWPTSTAETETTTASVIAELERRCAVPEEADWSNSPPRYGRSQGTVWAKGWNACLARIKEMRNA